MMDVLDKPPGTAGPPTLPPFLRKRGGGGRPKWVILPDLMLAEQATTLLDREHNWITLAYRWMIRLNTETWEGERAFVHTRVYRQWLETYEAKDGLPPHICFGGAIEARDADLTFYPRWVEYAKETFC